MTIGGGLTSIDEGKKKMFPLLASGMGFDARTFGNHELYVKETVESLQLPGDFVTSNIVWQHRRNETLGNLYKIVGGDVLVLGFLYDMTNYDPTLVFVRDVEDCVKMEWFKQVVTRKDIRAIVVLAHMDYRHPLVNLVFASIRKLRGDDALLPVVIATGHTHQRRHRMLDDYAITLEAGKFMDTLGLVSFANQQSSITNGKHMTFQYVNPNANDLTALLGNDAGEESAKAQHLRKEINKVREQLDLDKQVGVLDKTYTLSVKPGASNSLISFWVDRVIEHGLFTSGKQTNRLFFIGGTGTIRYDLFGGKVTKDDLWIASPFADPFHVIRNVPGRLILQLADPVLGLMQSKLRPLNSLLPLYTHSSLSGIKILGKYDLVFGNFDVPFVLAFFKLHHFEVHSQVFREGEGVNGHSVWEQYFESLSHNNHYYAGNMKAEIN
ncbi:hypothetical protein BASA81_002721 [Batrachochytrium salamandrivorans]|nr:hypothetical protein BASA81_002721 [Batrachochytrium salamandrivorans]